MLTARTLIVLLVATIVALFSCSVARSVDNIQVELTPTSQPNKTAVKGGSFRGTIFNQDYPFAYLPLADSSSIKRFNLSAEDIQQAEIIFRRQIKALNRRHPNQIKDCPIIDQNIDNYFRQYVGFTDSKGHRVVHINFYWDKFSVEDQSKGYTDRRLTFESDYANVFDGCSYYWQINVDLTSSKVYGFSVNGVA